MVAPTPPKSCAKANIKEQTTEGSLSGRMLPVQWWHWLGPLPSPLPMPVTQNSLIHFYCIYSFGIKWKVLVVTTIKPSSEFQESSTNIFLFLTWQQFHCGRHCCFSRRQPFPSVFATKKCLLVRRRWQCLEMVKQIPWISHGKPISLAGDWFRHGHMMQLLVPGNGPDLLCMLSVWSDARCCYLSPWEKKQEHIEKPTRNLTLLSHWK